MISRRDFVRAVGALALGGAAPSAMASLLPASPFFGREFPDVQGRDFQLSSLLGKPVLANFWASWCPPCVREMPDLDALSQQHPDVAFVGLAIDTRSNVERFLQKVSVSYPILLTGTQGIPLMRDLGNKGGGLPFTVFFDRNGRSAEIVLGEIDVGDVRKRLAGLT